MTMTNVHFTEAVANSNALKKKNLIGKLQSELFSKVIKKQLRHTER